MGEELKELQKKKRLTKPPPPQKKTERSMSMKNRKIAQLSVNSVRKGGEIYRGKDLWKRNVLSLEWKSDGVVDGQSDDRWSRWGDLWKRWIRKRQVRTGWWNEFGSCFQKAHAEIHRFFTEYVPNTVLEEVRFVSQFAHVMQVLYAAYRLWLMIVKFNYHVLVLLSTF